MDIYITHQTYCLDQLIYLNMICHPPISTLFPYTTLFRSLSARKAKLIPTELAAWVGHGLFDHLVGLEENRRWDGQSQGLGSPTIDHEFELGWLLHGEVSWLGPLENLVHIGGGPSEIFTKGRSVDHEATSIDELP